MKTLGWIVILAAMSSVTLYQSQKRVEAQPAQTNWFIKSYSNGDYTLLHNGRKYQTRCASINNACSVLIEHIGESMKFQQGDDAGKNLDLLFLNPSNDSPALEIMSAQ